MYRKIIHIYIFFILVLPLYALDQAPKIELVAKALETTKTTVEGREGVVVYYNDSVIKADQAKYNKETKLLILEGNVEMIGERGNKEKTPYMEIQLDTKEVTFKELFVNSESDVWLFSKKAHKREGLYTLKESLMSSCNVKDPLWYMAFSDSRYNIDNKYIKIYNAKIYLAGVPIFYTPYLAFSTNKERTSGLLFPSVSYSNNEGYLYDQPLYWAISESMDLETNFQIRSERSIGLYSTFRFVDTNYSSGIIRVGYFQDEQNYVDEFNLLDNKHYGIEFNYESSKVFQSQLPKGYKDELYINTTFLNDIDYINLQSNYLRHFGLHPLQESRVNYFIHNNDNYLGVNAKYFIDTRKEDNSDTVQILPSIQWHKYLTQVLSSDLTYSIDSHINNLYRKEGIQLKQFEFKVPLEYTKSFFNDYIQLSFAEELYYSKNFFSNDITLYDKYEYYSNTHKIKVFTDLVKEYSKVLHVIQPSLDYIKPGSEKEAPVKFDLLSEQQTQLFSVGLPEEQYRLSLKQYVYDKTQKLKFFQRLSQIYYPNRELKWLDLNNEMQYNWGKWSFYNNLLYSHEYSDIKEMSSQIAFKVNTYHFSLGHSYAQNLSEESNNSITVNSVDFKFGYNYNEQINFYGAMNYDVETSASSQWMLGGNYKEDCWSIGAFLRQDITPRPAGVTKENSFGVQLNFIPFGGIDSSQLNSVVSDD